MRLVSLLLGGLLADFAGICAVSCTGGALLAPLVSPGSPWRGSQETWGTISAGRRERGVPGTSLRPPPSRLLKILAGYVRSGWRLGMLKVCRAAGRGSW